MLRSPFQVPLPINARHWIRASMPLGRFMVDMFSSCFVGDARNEIVRLVTPPARSGSPRAAVCRRPDPSMLPIRRLMNLSIRGGQR